MTVTRDAFLEAVGDPDQDVFIQLMKDGVSIVFIVLKDSVKDCVFPI